jgi:hypothetical protein
VTVEDEVDFRAVAIVVGVEVLVGDAAADEVSFASPRRAQLFAQLKEREWLGFVSFSILEQT